MAEQIYFLPYLRKGLSNYIKSDGSVENKKRAELDFSIKLSGTFKDSTPSEQLQKQLLIVGPADVKMVSVEAISQVYPPKGTSSSYNSAYSPFMEFYEEDFLWRYSPVATESPKFMPWVMLIAVNEEECKVSFNSLGKKVVTFNLSSERFKEVFPDEKTIKLLAHVQIKSSEPVTNDNVDSLLRANPECGISRLLCSSKLQEGKHVKLFLIPTFELGRRALLDEENLAGSNLESNLDSLSWNYSQEGDFTQTFPVYYESDFYTSSLGGTFLELAQKIHQTEDYSFPAYLTVNISESGLSTIDKKGDIEEEVIDIPAALTVSSEVNEDDLRQETTEFTKALKDELKLNPVFEENATGKATENDPWIVPPVYGARHMLSKDFSDEKAAEDVVTETNIHLRNRIPADMGAKAIRENQEYLVNRAWQKVEKINQLNQIIREYYQMHHVNEAARTRIEKMNSRQKSMNTAKTHVFRTDASDRTFNTSPMYKDSSLNVDSVREQLSNSEALESSFFPTVEPVQGITHQMLCDLYSQKTWENIRNDEALLKDLYFKGQFNKLQKDLPFLDKVFGLRIKDNTPVFVQNSNSVKLSQIRTNTFLNGDGTKFYNTLASLYPDDDTCDYNLDSILKMTTKLINNYKNMMKADSYIGIDNCDATLHRLALPVDLEDGGFVLQSDVFDNLYNKLKGSQSSGSSASSSQGVDLINLHYYDQDSKESTLRLVKSSSSHLTYYRVHPLYDVNDTEGISSTYEFIKPVEITIKDGVYTHADFSSGSVLGLTSKRLQDPLLQIISDMKDLYKAICNTKGYTYEISYNAEDKNRFLISYTHKGTVAKTNVAYDYTKNFYVSENSDFGLSLDSNGSVKINLSKLKPMIGKVVANMETVNKIFWEPNYAVFKDSTSKIELSCNDFINSWDTDVKGKMKDAIGKIASNVVKSSSTLDIKPQATSAPDDTVIDATAEGQSKIDELIQKYGDVEELQVSQEQLEKKARSKYPVMAYPIYLDPTFFYLRKLSEKFVLPSSGALKKDSVSVFFSNAKFEEAFLLGMNTEMGKELLWREYPTDQRGSYFRKFWDQKQLPDSQNELETNYFDVKEITPEDWTQSLGKNHLKNNGMLVLAIKSELMQAFPKTQVYLATIQGKTITSVLEPAMTSWLNSDTYLVGFEGLTSLDGWNLVFQQSRENMSFKRDGEEVTSSSLYAHKRVLRPYIHIISLHK